MVTWIENEIEENEYYSELLNISRECYIRYFYYGSLIDEYITNVEMVSLKGKIFNGCIIAYDDVGKFGIYNSKTKKFMHYYIDDNKYWLKIYSNVEVECVILSRRIRNE